MDGDSCMTNFAGSFNHVPLGYASRNGHTECIHSGSIAVVDTSGRLVAYVGDPASYTFSRSALKPFQALPFARAGGIAQFGFDQKQTALMCASHSGEDIHIAAVGGMLEKIGCTEHDLGCGCHMPERYENGEIPPVGFKPDQRHNNCSGKHAGFLAFCRMHDLPTADYLNPAHPLQTEIVKTVAQLAGMDARELWHGTDGCNAPNLGLPVARLARLWAQFGSAREDGDNDQRAMARLADAMMDFPEMYSGTGRADNALTRVGKGRWISKTGADGVRCVGIRSKGLGIALKVAGGHYPTAYAATIEVMRQLDVIDAVEYEELKDWAQPVSRNCIGREVGTYRCEFQLKFV